MRFTTQNKAYCSAKRRVFHLKLQFFYLKYGSVAMKNAFFGIVKFPDRNFERELMKNQCVSHLAVSVSFVAKKKGMRIAPYALDSNIE